MSTGREEGEHRVWTQLVANWIHGDPHLLIYQFIVHEASLFIHPNDNLKSGLLSFQDCFLHDSLLCPESLTLFAPHLNS
jgi:hypothetical protein